MCLVHITLFIGSLGIIVHITLLQWYFRYISRNIHFFQNFGGYSSLLGHLEYFRYQKH